MNKLSIIVASLLVSVILPASAFAACSHGHGSGAAGLLGNTQNKVEFCKGGGYIYLSDPYAHCPK